MLKFDKREKWELPKQVISFCNENATHKSTRYTEILGILSQVGILTFNRVEVVLTFRVVLTSTEKQKHVFI